MYMSEDQLKAYRGNFEKNFPFPEKYPDVIALKEQKAKIVSQIESLEEEAQKISTKLKKNEDELAGLKVQYELKEIKQEKLTHQEKLVEELKLSLKPISENINIKKQAVQVLDNRIKVATDEAITDRKNKISTEINTFIKKSSPGIDEALENILTISMLKEYQLTNKGAMPSMTARRMIDSVDEIKKGLKFIATYPNY